MRRPATLSDVAKAANLSPTTISRHINGSINLPEETVRRIDAAIVALRYRPNPHARSLGRGRSDTIGWSSRTSPIRSSPSSPQAWK